jgi:carotenoid cleavage dioxygenase-like enzyme
MAALDTLVEQVKEDRNPTDTANVNVVDLGGRVIAMTGSARHIDLDPATLETRGEVIYEDDLEGQLFLRSDRRSTIAARV